MRIRRMRRRMKKRSIRTRRVYRRRRTYSRRGNASEIKYVTYIANDQKVTTVKTGSLATDLYPKQAILANILDQIAQGTNYGNRIGNKIFVMSINVRVLVAACPEDSTYAIGNFLIRHIWHSSRSGGNVGITNFFENTSFINFNSYINRKILTVHADKTFTVRADASTTPFSGTYVYCGAVREINYTIPVNRYVTYTQAGVVKEDYNVFSFAQLGAVPNLPDNKQIACSQIKFRVYFKDT